MHDMNNMQNKRQNPTTKENNISHSRKWQELELRIWKVVSGALQQIKKGGVMLDNRFVVPYNRNLLVKYQAHINVEKVNHDGMHKYLFKYVTKGFDCARIGIHTTSSTSASSSETVNEIDNYLECRCVTPNDAGWRCLSMIFTIQNLP